MQGFDELPMQDVHAPEAKEASSKICTDELMTSTYDNFLGCGRLQEKSKLIIIRCTNMVCEVCLVVASILRLFILSVPRGKCSSP